MECVEDKHAAASVAASPAATAPAPSSTSPAATQEPEEKAKRTKHSRVQKREKELYGLVTPVFLPLLDARDSSPQDKKKKPPAADSAPRASPEQHAAPTGNGDKKPIEARKSRRAPEANMPASSSPTTTTTPEATNIKKPKRTSSTPSTTKKSALRTTTTHRRKRVSLVIDGHTVLPADTVAEPALASPSSEATSASNSTASLDEMIDPRLIAGDGGAVHHSLPLPMSMNTRETKMLVDNTPLSPAAAPFVTSPPKLPALPSPESISTPHTEDEEPHFDTYVGGLRGSGADDVDQAGSYGYPSSLGASYLESYMQSRPLKVRMEAVEKAELGKEERERMIKGDEIGEEGENETGGERRDEREVDEGMDIMGEMEGF